MATKRQIQIVENFIKTTILKEQKKLIREEDVTDDDYFQGNYSDVEKYKNIMAHGVSRMSQDCIQRIKGLNMKKKNDPYVKLIKNMYKVRMDTVDAIDYVCQMLKDDGEFGSLGSSEISYYNKWKQ